MRSLKFIISGKTAFFKVPEVNAVHYFTYGNIHKPALLGILGAVAGYGGYARQKEKDSEYPEYYEKLAGLNVSILPLVENGCFERKIQRFNNSVGYASQEQGGNLVVSEQWLEEPAWKIYIKLDCDEADIVANRLISGSCIYVPYLGKNDHPASITDVETADLREVGVDLCTLSCLAPESAVEYDDEFSFRYQEYLPVKLAAVTNQYISEKFILTDACLTECKTQIYEDDGDFLVFY